MTNIIGFSGRLGNGKTELAKICENYGYERLYFAKPLKTLIANLISGTIDDVNRLKNGDEATKWEKAIKNNDIIFIAQETKIPIKYVKDTLSGVVFHNTRDMLQVIGTDLIRKYNVNWHVERTIALIETDKKYVIDDVRFSNEKAALENKGAEIWFVIRPNIDNISHHSSEETLKWQDFQRIIINNHSLEFLQMSWNLFMSYGYDNSSKLRDEQLYKLYNNSQYQQNFIEKVDPFSILIILQINPDIFTYRNKFKNNNQISHIIPKEKNTIEVTYKDGTTEIVSNALEIEDLKFYIK